MDNSAGCPCGALIATERSSLTVKDLRPIELSSLPRLGMGLGMGSNLYS